LVAMATPPETARPAREGDVLREARDAPRSGVLKRVRSNPGLRHPYRICVFALGLAFIALGIALMALPGPLTIPPVLLGLWIWSTEFRFAERFFESFKEKGREAWAHAKRHPKSSAAVTGGGLLLAAAAFWAVGHFSLVERGREALNL